MMLHTKYQGSRPCGLRQECFFTFPYISLCKTFDPQDRPIFSSSKILCIILVEVHLVMLLTKYQGSRSVVSDKKIFKVFILKVFF